MAKRASKAVRPTKADAENPELSAADFKRMRPAREALSTALYQELTRRRGPQVAPTKQPVTMRLDPDIVATLKSSGAGWQGRVNDMLRSALGLTAKRARA